MRLGRIILLCIVVVLVICGFRLAVCGFRLAARKGQPKIVPLSAPSHPPGSAVKVLVELPPHYRWLGARGWVFWFHGYNGYASDMVIDIGRPMAQSLLHAGYALVSTEYTNRACWGNAHCDADVTAALDAARSRFHFRGDPYCVGWSMGGVVALNAIAHGVIHCKAAEMVFPAYDLMAIYQSSTGFDPSLETAYGFKGAQTLRAATSRSDPALDSPNVFRATPMDIHCSATDTVLPCAANGKALADALARAGGHVTFTLCHGQHGDPSCIVPQAAVDLFEQH